MVTYLLLQPELTLKSPQLYDRFAEAMAKTTVEPLRIRVEIISSKPRFVSAQFFQAVMKKFNRDGNSVRGEEI